MDDMVEEIRAGRCRPFFKEIPRAGTSSTKVTELTIGPKKAEHRKKLIIKSFGDINAWKSGERSFHIVKELVQQGFDEGTYRIPQPIDKDPHNLAIIEERIEGENLFDTIVLSESTDPSKYLKMAARWLSKLHNMKLKISPPDEYLRIEPERIAYYLKSLAETKNTHLQRALEIKDMVLAKEIDLIEKRPEILVQGHGDYHPKNIFINKEDGNEFVAVIDFDSSYQLPRAFDVGTFLAQYINMFFNEPGVKQDAPSDVFLETYLSNTMDLEDDFMDQVHLYKARTCMSIMYYLAKVHMGDSENFFRILVEAEKNLAAIL
jgi:thiamine kinase-like enzyme